jgi:ATP-binding cassette, subfamily B (MDR/TAP), member 1
MPEDHGIRSHKDSAVGADAVKSEAHPASPASIFAFISKKHLKVLIPALMLTILAGAIKPAITIFLGRIFDELAGFGAGTTTQDELLQNISTWCVALTGLGVAIMIINGGFFSLWLVFGEMQARSARDRAFISMLEEEMEWYDLRSDGIGSLLVRIQTCVVLEWVMFPC